VSAFTGSSSIGHIVISHALGVSNATDLVQMPKNRVFIIIAPKPGVH
jgi:hypothetical protein